MKKQLKLEKAIVLDTDMRCRGHRILVESDGRLSYSSDQLATRKLAGMLWKQILLPSLEAVGAPIEIPKCLRDIRESEMEKPLSELVQKMRDTEARADAATADAAVADRASRDATKRATLAEKAAADAKLAAERAGWVWTA